MEDEFIIHEAIRTLYKHNRIGEEGQEDCLKRYLKSEFIAELETLLRKYNVGYDCDFEELQKRITHDVKKNIYSIVD